MKKLTKKAIAAAPKYVVTIDYRATYKPLTLEYKAVEADSILDAMRAADELFNTEQVYLLKIKEKTGRVRDDEFLIYEDRLVSRSRGEWHLADEAHHERAFEAEYHVATDTFC